MKPIRGKPEATRRVQEGVSFVSPKAIHVVVAFSAALLLVSAPLCGAQAKTDPPGANPAPDTPKQDAVKQDPARPAAPAWRDKQIPDWTEADAKQLLADSPWAKSVTASVDKTAKSASEPSRGRRRIGIGGFGIGRRSAATDTASSSTSSTSSSSSSSSSPANKILRFEHPRRPSTLRLRWESALPIREAELKSPDVAAPTVDENQYAIADYGIPGKLVKDDSPKAADQLKTQATIKRDAKADLKPSSVEILLREDGPVVVYLFPRTEEITWRDHQIEFNAQVGQLKFKQVFASDDMRFHGTLEL